MIKFSRLFIMLMLSLALMFSLGCPSEPEVEEAPATTEAAPADNSGLQAMLDDAEKTINTAPIYFDFDRYDLNEGGKNVLKVKAELLKQFPALSVKIEGHCDSRGTDEYNLALGERRAKAAYDYLIMMGVDPSQLSFVSYGKMYPAMEGNNEEAWSKNRRDEFATTINLD